MDKVTGSIPVGPSVPHMKKNKINTTFEKYHFRPYPAQSKNWFRQEKVKLQRLLGSSVSVFHVGSTAIPGMGGKGILDVLITIPRATTRRATRILEKGGYVKKKTTKHPTRIFFAKDLSVKGRAKRMHIHLTHKGSKVERSMLALCHNLQVHQEEAKG